eukprot:CAMPEP_0194345782 /NCGR_PEP_ID=MMETSP0171-20130528/105051_1 /TAXON_ID=218684 /ORGANISM="Corethron pennatum, Strain L29A3" /LENGTH=129 /DNA_ID=CAMNT_0039112807 /DNA_START=52 /DNA_END=441 /DNA_ORIENTATION=+
MLAPAATLLCAFACVISQALPAATDAVAPAFAFPTACRRGAAPARDVTVPLPRRTALRLRDAEEEEEDTTVPVGSPEYYRGFVSRGLDEEPDQRVTGDAVLAQTLKFAGGAAAIIVLLTVGFLASNGII